MVHWGKKAVFSILLVSLSFVSLAACNTVPRDTVQMGPYEKYDRLHVPEAPRFTANASAQTTMDADLDDGGEVGSEAYQAYAIANFPLWEGAFGWGMASYERRNYDFSGNTKFFNGVDDPFEDFNNFRITGVLGQALSPEWGLGAAASMQHSWETGADIEDGRGMFYALGGFYVPNKDLLIAAGIGISDNEDGDGDRDRSVIPGIQLMWRFADQWEAFILGSSAWVQYTFADHWIARLGFDVDNDTWRIDRGLAGQQDQALATMTRIPVYMMITYQVSSAFDINLSAGAVMGRNLEIDYGDTDQDDDIDSSLFVRLGFTLFF